MKILIVEDEPGILSFLQQGLEEEGYEIQTANNGIEGLNLALNYHFDLIILDWMLPKMQGIDVCKSIRVDNNTVPILFLTAKDTVLETIEALKAGANDYIKKPFSFEELLERIKVHFRTHNQTNEKLLLANVVLDTEKHQVFLDNKEVVLTQREFELLAYLIKNKGKVCHRNQIIKDVWNIHFDYDSGVIDVFINSIRKKLNLKPDQPIIKAIRGIGYIANDK